MSDEIKAAAERRRNSQYRQFCTGNPVGDPRYWPSEQKYYDDADILANAYLAAEAAREAELAERAIPIDANWLRPLCVSISTPREWYWYVEEYVVLVRWSGGFHLKYHDRTIAEQATRGDLMDLLKGLKIPTKQQQNDTSNPETEVTNA